MSLFFIIAAIVIFIVAAIIAWPAHVTTLLCIGLACLAASFLPLGNLRVSR